MIDRSALMNAFLPATELDDPDRFAGRSSQVRQLADSLHVAGSTPLIYGDRGLGKSSLALQLRLIAMGNVELLHQLHAERLALKKDNFYLTFYITCTDSTETFQDLLQALVNAAESVENVQNKRGAHEIVDRTTRRKLSLKIMEVETTQKYQTESRRLSYQDLNLEEKLVQLCELLTAAYQQPVLFIIDELDRMRSTKGLASFLKAASSDRLKFLLVGISNNVGDLLSDHQSLERRLQPVLVPTMSDAELAQIVVKAEAFLRSEGIKTAFTSSAIRQISRVASGFPWFVHVLGQAALVSADEEGRSAIDRPHVEKAVKEIIHNRLAQQFADMYQRAVRDSGPREMTLRAFAQWTDSDVPTGEVYKILASLGVTTGSTYRGHLCKPEYGDILLVPATQKRGLVRFRNEMFKAYVRMRPSIYSGVDLDVKRAYSQR